MACHTVHLVHFLDKYGISLIEATNTRDFLLYLSYSRIKVVFVTLFN